MKTYIFDITATVIACVDAEDEESAREILESRLRASAGECDEDMANPDYHHVSIDFPVKDGDEFMLQIEMDEIHRAEILSAEDVK